LSESGQPAVPQQTKQGPWGTGSASDAVQVTLPASSAYLSVLRTATAGLAARLDFTLDEIEDLRIAVDEACAMLLPQAAPGAELSCTFVLESDGLLITVSAPTTRGSLPERETFSWTVLTALAGEVDAGVGEGLTVWISLHKRRELLASVGS
jgi:serine/threonine-protein kinase RsbW